MDLAGQRQKLMNQLTWSEADRVRATNQASRDGGHYPDQ